MKHYLTEDSTLSCEEEVKSLRAKVEAQAKEIERLREEIEDIYKDQAGASM